MQKPSIGRIVIFCFGPASEEVGKEIPAIITKVNSDTSVALFSFDPAGQWWSHPNVPFETKGDIMGSYWKWPVKTEGLYKIPAPAAEQGEYLVVDSKRKWVDRETIKPGDKIRAEVGNIKYNVFHDGKLWQMTEEGYMHASYSAANFLDFFTNAALMISKPKFFLIK